MKGFNLAEKNGMWKGDEVGYIALHNWIRRRLPKPDKCPICNKKRKLDLCNKSRKYKRDVYDWHYMCRKCHMESDGRKNNLLIGNEKKKLKPCQICKKLTKGIKFCKICSKERRRLWWIEYNQRPKRKKYLKKYLKKHPRKRHR